MIHVDLKCEYRAFITESMYIVWEFFGRVVIHTSFCNHLYSTGAWITFIHWDGKTTYSIRAKITTYSF